MGEDVKSEVTRILGRKIVVLEAETERLRAERDREPERADRLEQGLRDVLDHFQVFGYPGAPCVRTPWIYTEKVDGWRALVDSDGDSEGGED